MKRNYVDLLSARAADLISKGWVINLPTTNGIASNELGRVDLIKGNKLIRLYLTYMDADGEGLKVCLVCGGITLPDTGSDALWHGTIWDEDLSRLSYDVLGR